MGCGQRQRNDAWKHGGELWGSLLGRQSFLHTNCEPKSPDAGTLTHYAAVSLESDVLCERAHSQSLSTL